MVRRKLSSTIAEETNVPSKKHTAAQRKRKELLAIIGDNIGVSTQPRQRVGTSVGSGRSSRQSEEEGHTEAVDSTTDCNASNEDVESVDGDERVLMEIDMPRRLVSNVLLSEPGYGVSHDAPRTKSDAIYSTPLKTAIPVDGNDTPNIQKNLDRAARRKSTRTLMEQTVLGTTSDDDDEDGQVARYIYGSDEEEEDDDGTDGKVIDQAMPANEVSGSPSKRKSQEKYAQIRQASPDATLSDLSAHEKYFFHNRGGRIKTSDNNLSSLALLDHEEYFSLVRKYEDPHTRGVNALQELYARSFRQWEFELSQQFSLCLYGWGSKKSLLMKFADHIYKSRPIGSSSKIVVINGYVHNLTIRDVLHTVASAIANASQKIGSHAVEMIDSVVALLEENRSQLITLIVHSIDRTALRRPLAQAIISRLAAHPQVQLVASADHPSFPLLWDSSLRAAYNFVFHDCTTFEAYSVEVDVVDEVHELLGRSGRRVGGKEGVNFVLKSLPENAKNLFRILIGEQLAVMDGTHGNNAGEPLDYDDVNEHESRYVSSNKTDAGVEYRVLYQKAVEEFICSNEMNFRTLLKE
jgi:origin recognition complex subunit 2